MIEQVTNVRYKHRDMPKLTFAQAARAAGKSRQQISRLVENGKLSKEESSTGGFVIDAAELMRVYPEADLKNAQVKTHGAGQSDRPANTVTPVQDELIELLKDERDRLRVELDNANRERRAEQEQARLERDRLLGIVETVQRQLTHEASKPEPLASQPRGWWPFRK